MSRLVMKRSGLQAYPTTRADLLSVGFNMREADRREIVAWTGGDPVFRLAASAEKSDWSVTVAVTEGDARVCIFGVAPHPEREGAGMPWMIATPEIENHPYTFLRMCSYFVQHMLEDYPVLENYVDARNRLAVKWLTWCGFIITEILPEAGYEKAPFYRMERSV